MTTACKASYYIMLIKSRLFSESAACSKSNQVQIRPEIPGLMSLDSLPPSLFDTKHTCAALCSLETSHESCLELPNRADHVQNLSSDKLRVQLSLCCKSRCWPQSESECGKSVSSGVKGAARQFSTPIMLLGVSMDAFKIGSAELVIIILCFIPCLVPTLPTMQAELRSVELVYNSTPPYFQICVLCLDA